ncbi:MAG: hypothetical protein IMF10_09420 [Proteobacteria bacterium]|nr:hypothetical protein [Pseudomonadota bacterium]
MKAKYLDTLKEYNEKFGAARVREIEDKFRTLEEEIMSENESVLTWLPPRKKDETIGTLLQKTYQDLINEMEEEMGK